MRSEDGKTLEEQLFIALQMAALLRELVAKRGMPKHGIPKNQFPPPPFPQESFESACHRIFGDYVYTWVLHEREMHKKCG